MNIHTLLSPGLLSQMLLVLFAASSLSGGALGQAVTLPATSDSACFERWSHFKDYGVPGTVSDPLNQAAIADGTCRLLGPDNLKLDGSAMWNEPARVKGVLMALKDAPATDRPSYFVRSTRERLLIPCSTPHPTVENNFSVKSVAASLQNWYHALCAPQDEPSWKDAFDPAEQPQQMAITSGLVCIVACDTKVDADTMASVLQDPQKVRDNICKALPYTRSNKTTAWNHADFTKATSSAELSRLAAPLRQTACTCAASGALGHGELLL